MDPQEERKLLTAWRNGDRRAGDRLVSSCIDTMFDRALIATGGNLAEAKDIVQASFEVALRKKHLIKIGFGKYVRGVCTKKIYEYIRNKGRLAAALHTSLWAQIKNPDSAVRELEHERLAMAAMSRLSEEQQKFIYLKNVEQLKFREIAELFDLTVSQASKRYYTAVECLKSTMQELAESPDALAMAVSGLSTWIRSIEDENEGGES